MIYTLYCLYVKQTSCKFSMVLVLVLVLDWQATHFVLPTCEEFVAKTPQCACLLQCYRYLCSNYTLPSQVFSSLLQPPAKSTLTKRNDLNCLIGSFKLTHPGGDLVPPTMCG